jgi:dTDP-4-dehydrorhamnose reductase
MLLLEKHPPSGTYHGTNSGDVTWFDFTREIFRHAGADPARVLPTTSAQFVRPAPRPAYSVLGHDKWAAVGLPQMRPWQDALDVAFAEGIAAG